MLVTAELIQDSVSRMERSGTKIEKLASKLGEGDRSKRVSETTRMHRLSTLLNRVEDPIVANTLLERVIGGNDLVGINYLAIGTLRARSVCRVHLRDSSGATVGFGTGFMIGPGVLLTNHHVIAGLDEARNSLAEFDYEYDVRGKDRPVAAFRLLSDPAPFSYEPLDFCLVGVAPRSEDGRRALDEFGWLPLNPTPGKAIVGEYLTIIQHPGGERKQTCVRENKLLKYDENGATLWYHTDTVGGSSGSPVFNQAWEVVALHHSGVPETNSKGQWLTVDGKVWDSSMDESRIQWKANEGIRISTISEYVRTRKADNPLAQPIVHPQASPLENGHAPGELGAGSSVVVRDNVIHVTTPFQFAIGFDGGSFGRHLAPDAALNAYPSPVVPPSNGGGSGLSGIEAVQVDQSNYDERPGYDANFLGDGELSVRLPVVARPAYKAQILEDGTEAGGELRYWTYTVVMNRGRRLAFFSAANVDAERRPKTAGRDGDKWFVDTRTDARFQLGSEFYGRQKEFEVDRESEPLRPRSPHETPRRSVGKQRESGEEEWR